MATEEAIKVQFTAKLRKSPAKGGWSYVIWPESAAFFGREIGLMYVHAHLRYGEAMAVLGEADALWDALQVVNPVTVAERVANASARQRNTNRGSSARRHTITSIIRYQASYAASFPMLPFEPGISKNFPPPAVPPDPSVKATCRPAISIHDCASGTMSRFAPG